MSDSSSKPSKVPEIAVFFARPDALCCECGEELEGAMITLRGEGNEKESLCLDCADLGRLEFLPSGNAALTRRATKYTGLRAVVLKWSRSRKRFERQGILVDRAAIEQAEEDCLADGPLRERRNARRREREVVLDAKYVTKFAEAIMAIYPSCPPESAEAIAAHACRKHSGRVGRSAGAKEFAAEAITLAVRAHLRHKHTSYERLLMTGWDRDAARAEISGALGEAEARWRG
jgi:hypothetical protein